MVSLSLSPSRANQYKQCPLKYRYQAIDRLPEPSTIHQVKGTLVHAVLENLHQIPREERTYPRAVKMIKPQWEKIRTDPKAVDLESLPSIIPDEMQFFIECRELIKGYFLMENPAGFESFAQEEAISTILPNGVPVKGFIDRIDIAPTGEVRIVDYKTGKKPLPRYSQEAQLQMLFYALVYWRLHGEIPTLLRLMYLKVQDDLTLRPTAGQLTQCEDELGELWSKIERDGMNGTFAPKESKLCDWCFFQDLCPARGGVERPYPGWPGSAADAPASSPA